MPLKRNLVINILMLITLTTIFLLLINNIYKHYNTLEKKEEIIEEVIKEEVKKEEKQKEEKLYEFLTNSYLGYIEIEKVKIKSLIEYGTTDNILDKNIVGLHKASTSLDDPFGNIILAGHNNSYVFKNLFKVKLNEKIKLVTHKSYYEFKVTKIDRIKKTDFKYFNYVDDKKIITLITCINENERLIIRGEEV